MKVAVIGTGYVGLVTGTCFAEMGNDVICVDIDRDKIEKLSNGRLTIFEPGLEVFFDRNRREKRLSFSTNLKEAIDFAEIVFLALPTPPDEDGSADLSYVLNAASQIGNLLKHYTVVVNKSTVPVGTADLVRAQLEQSGKKAGINFDVVSNPEFLREGVAVEDFMKPERVVIGTSSKRAENVMSALYEPFVRNGNPLIVMDERSAEMTKYAANAFLATKITFMNEMANLCERIGANIDKIRIGIGTDSRIGKQFLYPGIGFGGSCFPKDVQALAFTANQAQQPSQILNAVLKINKQQQERLAKTIISKFDGNLKGKKVAVWGLAFKANTDDVRESSSHVIIRLLLEVGAHIVAFDPEAMETTKRVLGDTIEYADNCYGALCDADFLVICTEWNEFRRPDFEKVKSLLKAPIIFDGRNLYDPILMKQIGFDYTSIGRPYLNNYTSTIKEEI